MSLKERIRTAAWRAGFQRCGVSRVDTPQHAAFVRRWLANGNAAAMAYIERGLAKRLDPRLLLPEIRSLISLAHPYLPPPLPPIDWRAEMRGRIAAYAFATDYHLTVKRKLRELAAHISALRSDAIVRPYVDSAPVLEREWAASGGIGWFGKNTNILHTQDGSYFFLAELLTNLDLEPDPPVTNRCGTCSRCLDQCPTQALTRGYLLDARLCVAFLTIEHRGVIPAELRPQMGSWIFGCDVCQEVCPWNEKLVRRNGTPDREALVPYLPDILLLDEPGFRSRFRHSAIRRAQRDGFLRNVTVALGNTRNPSAVGPLRHVLHHDSSPLVRSHAAWALGAIGNHAALQALESVRRSETNDDVLREIEAAL